MPHATINSFRFHCRLGCGDIPFSRSKHDKTEEDAIQRHYNSPVHHEHHVYIEDGKGCPCGINNMIEPVTTFTWCDHNAPWDDMSDESKAAVQAVVEATGAELARHEKGDA